ncbi:MAG: hypothetical protein HFH08_05050 [Bacilli bacterium]|nr:hypothetical protein [Bacilli bacterium]
MKEKTLILLDGDYIDYKGQETKYSKILGILDLETGIFKGIELLSNDCDIRDYNAFLYYLYQSFRMSHNFSLIAGYYDGKSLQYRNLLLDKTITFGEFELRENEHCLVGREKISNNGRLTRNLNRPVNHYQAIVLSPQFLDVQGKINFVNYFTYLYEIIEGILMKESCNSTWKGIQISMENLAPKIEKKVYMLTPCTDEVK